MAILSNVMRTRNWISSIGAALIAAGCLAATGIAQQDAPARAEETQAKKKQPEEKVDPVYEAELDLMRRTVVEVMDGTAAPRAAKRIEQAVFRYGDETQRIENSTVWVWLDQGRPVAVQKVEVNKYFNPPGWTYCFSALGDSRVKVQWPNVRRPYHSREPVEFKPITGAPQPGPKPLWKQQARSLARQFSATAGAGQNFVQLRLLPKPLLEYESPSRGILAGSLFNLATGTNPTIFLIIELHETDEGAAWRYGIARATSHPIQVKHGEALIKTEAGEPRPGHFANWTYNWLPGK